MNITKYPQYQLYLLTLNLWMFKNQIISANCDERCVDSTIINRAYFSSYLMCELWLDDVKNFRPIPIMDLEASERIGEHLQVRNALYNFGEKIISDKLSKLAKLRKKADYDPFCDLTQADVSNAIGYMENIFSHLKFD
ncbi:MAG: hypothetical protein Q4Q14_08850 [Methanobrevibacter sp.]|nr:hypothetical protein [Methanobrevibacter sp.]